ncbi:MAG TPA: hypothetical protein VM753_18680 [Anaeromyxobacter sp.]|jgi:hypothetical protein|nr:hypothetical protein [Anaeromyxobacter sp.]
MSRLAVAVLLTIPLVASSEPPRAEGRIEAGDARVEILGRPYRVGETIQLPEGYLRVEEAGPEDEEVGSFTVVPASEPTSLAAAVAAARAPAGMPGAVPEEPPPPPLPAAIRCRAERAAFLAEIWKGSGIEVQDPEALLEAFEGAGDNPDLAKLWFALSTDAFRPLAWSSDARGKAKALSRCVRGM